MHKHQVYKQTKDTYLRVVLRTLFLNSLTLLCFYAALWMIQDIFPDWQMGGRAQIWAGGFIFITIAIYEAAGYILPSYQWACRLLLPVLYGIAAYRYIKPWQIEFEDGGLAFATQFLEKYNKHLRTSFSIWHGKEEWIQDSFAVWAIGITILLLLLALFTGRRIFLLLLPGFVLAGELLVGYTPKWRGMALFFIAVLFAYSGEGDGRWIDLPIHRQRQKHTLGIELLGSLPVICAAAVALLLAAVSGPAFHHAASKLMEQAPKVKEFQRIAEYVVSNFAASFFTSREEDVNNRMPYYTGKEVMDITASKKPAADLFLKGFCGTDYENGKWVCREEAFQDACQQAGYGQEDTSRHLLQVTYDAFADGVTIADVSSSYYEEPDQKRQKRKIDYTITYTGLTNHIAYLPYLLDYSDREDERQLQSDTAVRKPRGRKTFTVHGYNCGINYGTSQIIPPGWQTDISKWYDDFVKHTYLSVPAQKALQPIVTVEDYLETIMPSEGENYPAVISISLAIGENENIHTSIRKREIVELFHSLQQELQQVEDALVINHIRMMETLIISAMLKQNSTYSTQLDTLAQGEDAVHCFLMKSHKGYCVHFASAAVLLLRESGVPARFASGYVVRKKAFHKSEGGYAASVVDNNAHAWVEIYLEQIGWVPIDVTPGDYTTGTQGNQPLSPGTNAQASNAAQPDKKPEQPSAPQPEQKEPAKTGQLTAIKKLHIGAYFQKVLLLFAGFSVCVLGVAACHLRRKYLALPQKEIRAGQYQQAVSRMNRRLYRKLYLLGKIRRKSLTDAQYRNVLESTYPHIRQEDWAHYMQVAKAAAFSDGGVCKEDACFCEKVYERVCGRRKNGRHEKF